MVRGQERLTGCSASPRLDAELLLCEVLCCGRSHLYAHPERPVGTEKAAAFERLLERRAGGEPVALIRGQKEFWSLTLNVRPGVLIPRPETELLVELALALAPDAGALTVADLGTGSGAIALALATERPAWRVIATDTSPVALALAGINQARLGVSNMELLRGTWLAALARARLDLIVANPPYIAPEDPHLSAPELTHEPRHALVSARRGQADIEAIAAQAGPCLKPGGYLILEHGRDQGPAVRRALDRGGFTEINTLRDLAGLARASVGRRPGTRRYHYAER
jgi:release factor glutamine methyltransferase